MPLNSINAIRRLLGPLVGLALGIGLTFLCRGPLVWLLLTVAALSFAEIIRRLWPRKRGQTESKPFGIYLLIVSVGFALILSDTAIWIYDRFLADADIPAQQQQIEAKIGQLKENGPITVPAELISTELWRGARIVMPADWRVRKVKIDGIRRGRMWQGVEELSNKQFMRHLGPYGPKAPGTFRILVVGDSLTYGVGIREADTYPAQIQQQLGSTYRVDVINLGVPGYNSTQVLQTLKEMGPSLQPDLIIYGACLNDFLPSGGSQVSGTLELPLPAFIKDYFRFRTYTIETASNAFDGVMRRFHLMPSFFDQMTADLPLSSKRYESEMQEMNQIALSWKLPPVVAMVLDQYPSTTGPDQELWTEAQRAMNAAGMDLVDTKEYRQVMDGTPLGISRWEGHPNAIADRIFAGFLVNHIKTLAPLQAFRQ